MATLQERLLHNLQGREKGFMLITRDKKKLGRQIRNYFPLHFPDERYTKKEIVEDGVKMTVCDYPDHFTPYIDQFIKNYYSGLFVAAKRRKAEAVKELPQKAGRVRKAVKKPVYRSSGK